jgi:hypothetical protein
LEAVARAGILTDLYSIIVWEGVFMAGTIEGGNGGVATLWEEWSRWKTKGNIAEPYTMEIAIIRQHR